MNHWVREHKCRSIEFQVGDLIYWKRDWFDQVEWATLIIQYGSGPMLIEKIYVDTFLGGIRLEVTDHRGQIVMGIHPDRVEKVKIGFKADP